MQSGGRPCEKERKKAQTNHSANEIKINAKITELMKPFSRYEVLLDVVVTCPPRNNNTPAMPAL